MCVLFRVLRAKLSREKIMKRAMGKWAREEPEARITVPDAGQQEPRLSARRSGDPFRRRFGRGRPESSGHRVPQRPSGR